jgi:hypothetical protein
MRGLLRLNLATSKKAPRSSRDLNANPTLQQKKLITSDTISLAAKCNVPCSASYRKIAPNDGT